MAPFRALPEFKQLQEEARKGGAEIGQSFRRDMKLISEVRAPFRGVRKFLYLTLGAAAGISFLFTVPAFLRALQGGEGAPTLLGTGQNLAINLVGIGTMVALTIWEQKGEEAQIVRVSRDETLSRLPLRLSTNRVVELAQLRETSRPIILAGSKDHVAASLQAAEKYREKLLERGVLLVGLTLGAPQQRGREAPPKKGFGGEKPKTTDNAAGTSLDDFAQRAKEVAAKGVNQVERRFRAEPVSPGEWTLWLQEQQELEGVKPGEDVYVVLRLDGRIRKSGKGMPDWSALVAELPPLDSVISKLER